MFTVSDNVSLSVTDLPATCQFTSVHIVNTSHSVQASNGRETCLAKFAVESAYHIILFHSHHRYLLGMKWWGEYFIDLALPFSLRFAPFIFSSFADLLEWILKHNYEVQFLFHYLDEFHTLGPPDSPVCQQNLDICVCLFSEWGIPFHPGKLEGPSTCVTVLGIKLDSMAYWLASLRRSLIVLLLFWTSAGLSNSTARERNWNI